MRLFIAIGFTPQVRSLFLLHQDRLRSCAPRGSFTAEENLHVTLAFLGEQDIGAVRELSSVVDGLDDSVFDIQFDHIGRFGGDIWWVGARKNIRLARLQRTLDRQLREARYQVDERPFTAHVTLARRCIVRDEQLSRSLCGPIPPIIACATRVSLMESTRIGGRLTYIELHGHDLHCR